MPSPPGRHGPSSCPCTAGRLPRVDCRGSTAAVDAGYAYAYVAGGLQALDVADGHLAFKVDLPVLTTTSQAGLTPMLSGKQMAYVVDAGLLQGFDLASRKLAWSLKLAAWGQPACANDVVYVLAAGTVLEACSGATGALLWTSNLVAGPYDGTMFETMIVTDNLGFVGTREYTLAIDLKTHQTVWTYGLGGAMSIPDRGVLYILSQSGAMAAINLQ